MSIIFANRMDEVLKTALIIVKKKKSKRVEAAPPAA